MTAKTTAERQRAFRADLKRQGLTEVRGIFAKPSQHKAVKKAAKVVLDAEAKSCQATPVGPLAP